jgi:hypothetical protein
LQREGFRVAQLANRCLLFEFSVIAWKYVFSSLNAFYLSRQSHSCAGLTLSLSPTPFPCSVSILTFVKMSVDREFVHLMLFDTETAFSIVVCLEHLYYAVNNSLHSSDGSFVRLAHHGFCIGISTVRLPYRMTIFKAEELFFFCARAIAKQL